MFEAHDQVGDRERYEKRENEQIQQDSSICSAVAQRRRLQPPGSDVNAARGALRFLLDNPTMSDAAACTTRIAAEKRGVTIVESLL